MPKMVLSPRLDITASSVSSQPPATVPSEAAPVSPEIEKLQVLQSNCNCTSVLSHAFLLLTSVKAALQYDAALGIALDVSPATLMHTEPFSHP